MRPFMSLFSLNGKISPHAILFLGCFVFIVCPVLYLLNGVKNELSIKNSNEKIVVEQINAISLFLRQANETTNKKLDAHSVFDRATQRELQAIRSSLNVLSADTQSQEIKSLIVNENKQISDQLLAIKTQLKAKTKKSVINHRYARLPFKVIGADIWNDEIQATIFDHGQYYLIAKGDTYSGWNLMDISYADHKVVFKNHLGNIAQISVS